MDICWKGLFPVSIAYFYFLSIIFFYFRLSQNTGFDTSINELIGSLTKENSIFLLLVPANLLLKFVNSFADKSSSEEYKKLFIFFLASFVFTSLLLFITWVLVPKKKSNVKGSSYECGYEPIGAPTANFEIHFYIVAILFIIFDVEILFFYPWAFGLARATYSSFIAMTVFLLTLLIGYAYEWVKGALEWEGGNSAVPADNKFDNYEDDKIW
jgi:NADH-quinone oxidoreductase subunit A